MVLGAAPRLETDSTAIVNGEREGRAVTGGENVGVAGL